MHRATGYRQVIGMSKTILPIISKDFFLQQAVVGIDSDIASERIVIIDRVTIEAYYNFKLQDDRILNFIVPIKHIDSDNLLIGILDDDGQYNAKFIDGVRAELINGNLVNIRP